MHVEAAVALALLPDFALILLGAGLRRVLHLGDHFWNGLEKLVYYVLFPALLFSGLVKTRIDWSAAAPMIGVAAGAMWTGMLLGLGARLWPISAISFASQYQCAFRFNSYIGLAVAGTLYGVSGIAAMGIVVGLMVPQANTAAVWMLARHGETGVWRELAIQWHKDLGRSLDYLETRSEFDREKLAYQGISLGTAQGPRLMALEPRLKAGVLLWGGLGYVAPAEVNSLHFAPRCTVPTLMVNGRFDMLFPLETSQLPMYRLLGAADKDHFLVDSGHVAFNQEVIRKVLGWLDRYLGPVKTR